MDSDDLDEAELDLISNQWVLTYWHPQHPPPFTQSIAPPSHWQSICPTIPTKLSENKENSFSRDE